LTTKYEEAFYRLLSKSANHSFRYRNIAEDGPVFNAKLRNISTYIDYYGDNWRLTFRTENEEPVAFVPAASSL
jgi:hypothetical protein